MTGDGHQIMQHTHIHEDKPPVSDGAASLFIDLIIWRPEQHETETLIDLLQEHGLGERSQTVDWLDKFTIRLSMWRGRYWSDLSDPEWETASRDLIGFILSVINHYHPKRVEYDTRAFAVGLARKVRRHKRPVRDLAIGRPGHHNPVWWVLTV